MTAINKTQLPNLLGLTSEQAVAAAAAVRIPVNVSLPAYKEFYRLGRDPGAAWDVRLPPVVRVLREDSVEGEVVKFVCRVPRVLGGKLESELAREEAGNEGGEVGGMAGARGGVVRLPVVGGGGGGGVTGDLETESVLIPMMGTARGLTYTLCLSSQIGCAMGCGFCETAQMGLLRSLSAAEIVAQWYVATHVVGIRPKNIVFMGMGEPLDNFDNVMQALSVLKDHNGAAVPISQITVSTVGKLDGLRKLREWIQQPTWHRLNLAVSLNAPNDEVRDSLMPVNRKWNLRELQQELIDWPRFGGNKFCIEYVLIPGVNDSREHAREIADFVRPLKSQLIGAVGGGGGEGKDTRERAVINIIPYNPRRRSPWPAPTEERVNEFIGWLIEERVFVKRRRTKGREMMGACGQLGNEAIRNRKLVTDLG